METQMKHVGYRHLRFEECNTFGFGVGKSTKGGVTVAYNSPKHLRDLTATDVVEFGVAVCSKKDVYCKASGRKYATQRLEKTPLTAHGDDFLDMIQFDDTDAESMELWLLSVAHPTKLAEKLSALIYKNIV